MKKFAVLSIFFSCVLLFSAALSSCSNIETEAAEKSDISAVTVSVDSFGSAGSSRSVSTGGIYCNKNVTFSGTIKNARNIKGLWAQIKHPGDELFVDLKKAVIQEEKWTCSLSFDKDDFFFIRFVAVDSNEKTSASSAEIIPVFVRSNFDDDSLWYIDRGQNTEYIHLKQKSELKLMDLSLPANKDFAQNGSFSIMVNSSEDDPISYSSIQIRDENNNRICEISNSSKSKESPLFEVTEKLLTASDDSLLSGKHYLKVCYTAVDVEIEAGYFIWWPESDFPKVAVKANSTESDSITLHTNEKFSVSIFDDDSLDEAFCVLLTEEEAESLSDKINSINDNHEDFIKAASKIVSEERINYFTAKNREREAEFSFASEESPQIMHLVSLVWDKTSARNFTFSDTEIRVIDGTVSAVIFDSPKNNEIPQAEVSANGSKATVIVKGSVVDTVGCKSIQFVWVSGTSTDEEKGEAAKKWLEKLDKESVSNSDENSEFKLWNAVFSSPRLSDNFLYQNFRFKIDLINDFGDDRDNDKFFLVKLTRNDGKVSYSDYKLLADNEVPSVSKIKVEVKKDNASQKTYLLAEVSANKALQVNGIPAFELVVSAPNEKDTSKKQILSLPLSSCTGKLLTFKKEIISGSTGIPNGEVSYIPSDCIKKISTITDGLGTPLALNSEETEPVQTEIIIDTIEPKIVYMAPEGETAKGSNIYKNGNKITVKFSEKVKKNGGKIILRQVSGWAIPPVFTEEDFSLIMEELDENDREILSRQENGVDMEDAENILGSNAKFPNDTYHGTGQYVGPYKKTVQGLMLSENGELVPDLSPKYVLDFDIDIWETDSPHYFGKTFEKGFATQQKYEGRGFESLTNILKVVQPKKPVRTADQIRKILEKIHYHERIIEVDSVDAQLSEDGTQLTLDFEAGPFEESDDLPNGREWELIVEKGSFIDVNGNEFGVLYGGKEITVKNSNKKDSFWSEKVARPVVRIDRYSYGLGIWQSDKNGNRAKQIISDKTNYLPQSHDSIKPTGYVRARIDCETKGAKINYTIKERSRPARTSNPPSEEEPFYIDKKTSWFYSYYTNTEGLKASDLLLIKKYDKSSAPEDGNTVSPVFAVGNGSYNKSFKDYVIAVAEKPGFESSAQEIEGVFQTVVQFVNPKTKTGSSATSATIGQKDVSIHGKMISNEDPYISPFPLRESQNGSPYLRRCYRENSDKESGSSLDYYWVSYEILADATFSFYNWSGSSYDWAENQGQMKAGEFTRFVSE